MLIIFTSHSGVKKLKVLEIQKQHFSTSVFLNILSISQYLGKTNTEIPVPCTEQISTSSLVVPRAGIDKRSKVSLFIDLTCIAKPRWRSALTARDQGLLQASITECRKQMFPSLLPRYFAPHTRLHVRWILLQHQNSHSIEIAAGIFQWFIYI